MCTWFTVFITFLCDFTSILGTFVCYELWVNLLAAIFFGLTTTTKTKALFRTEKNVYKNEYMYHLYRQLTKRRNINLPTKV